MHTLSTHARTHARRRACVIENRRQGRALLALRSCTNTHALVHACSRTHSPGCQLIMKPKHYTLPRLPRPPRACICSTPAVPGRRGRSLAPAHTHSCETQCISPLCRRALRAASAPTHALPQALSIHMLERSLCCCCGLLMLPWPLPLHPHLHVHTHWPKQPPPHTHTNTHCCKPPPPFPPRSHPL